MFINILSFIKAFTFDFLIVDHRSGAPNECFLQKKKQNSLLRYKPKIDPVKLFNRKVSLVSKALPQQHRTVWSLTYHRIATTVISLSSIYYIEASHELIKIDCSRLKE